MTAQPLPGRERFEQAYSGEAPPWEIGKPQKAFVEAADQVRGSILDAGCGTGENALFFAQRGHTVTGIDFTEAPIQRARRKAEERGLHVEFLVHDALRLSELGRRYDSVIDSGLFHVFSDEERVRYVESLASALQPGGTLFLMCFSDKEPGADGPRRVSEQEIRDAFSSGWEVLSISETRFEARADVTDIQFSPGGPFAWFCVVRREST
jgi:cyclopropane fatty-acyl-phospholipid synthase-like methyltransferase